ncbi:hypothetical protein BDF19DRAFT_453628 [Syncephalis fuscata]|nr:hypothetical protein BDF19DRAFT_453628 [Syncephalis fuscata]
MVLSLKTIIPLLAIVGAAVGQSTDSSGTVILSPGTANLTDTCKQAIKSTDVAPDCYKSTSGGLSEAVCKAPIDGAVGHFCTDAQISKALETLETACKTEMNDKTSVVPGLYEVWLVYPLSRDNACIKDSSGAYCFEAMKNATEKDQCEGCTLTFLKAGLKWKPSRSTPLATQLYEQQKASLNNMTQACNITIDDSSSSSTSSSDSSHSTISTAMFGSALFVVVSAALFSA